MANEAVEKLRRLQAEAQDALDDQRLAHRDERQISGFQAFLHFWTLVVRSFIRNRCPLRASGLAYASLLALVPMLAVVISVSASLLKSQGEEPIRQFIDTMVERLTPNAAANADADVGAAPARPGGRLLDPAEYERTRRDMAQRINAFVGNIQSGTLGVTGMVALLFVAISMLSRIEDTFNDIWGVPRGRSWFNRIVQYWGALTLGPIVLVVTATLTSGPYFEATTKWIGSRGAAGVLAMQFGVEVLPYAIWSLAFALFYQLMPNTTVHWRAAFIGGLVSGCLWQANSKFSVLYVSRVVTNSRIYGSLGMVPVFMIGLYFAWLIMLFGAQVAYAFQNRRTYLQERQAESVHQRGREFVALRLAIAVAARFRAGAPPAPLTALADEVGVPTRLAGQLLRAMTKAGLLAEVNAGEAAFVPARPLHQLSVQDVLQAIRTGAGLELATRDDAARAAVRAAFERVGAIERGAAETMTWEALAASSANGQSNGGDGAVLKA